MKNQFATRPLESSKLIELTQLADTQDKRTKTVIKQCYDKKYERKFVESQIVEFTRLYHKMHGSGLTEKERIYFEHLKDDGCNTFHDSTGIIKFQGKEEEIPFAYYLQDYENQWDDDMEKKADNEIKRLIRANDGLPTEEHDDQHSPKDINDAPATHAAWRIIKARFVDLYNKGTLSNYEKVLSRRLQRMDGCNKIAIKDPKDLPPGWTTRRSRSTGEMYYAHSSGKTQFERPTKYINFARNLQKLEERLDRQRFEKKRARKPSAKKHSSSASARPRQALTTVKENKLGIF